MTLKHTTDKGWRGYNFDELQEQLILTDARIEVRKHKLAGRVKEFCVSSEEKGPIAGAMKVYRYFQASKVYYRKIKSIIQRFRKKS